MRDLAITLLFSELAHDYTFLQAQKSTRDTNANVHKIIDFIAYHYAQPIRIKTLEGKFGYNPNYLSMLFKKCTGTSLVRYIAQKRIDVAKSLLLNSSNSIKSIAAQVGYADDKYFAKIFKALEHTTPSKFRGLYVHTHINTK